MNDLISNLTSEEKLLLSLCRLELSGERRAESVEMMKEIADWDRFVRLANEHGVIAITAYNIRENRMADQVPDTVMKILDNARMQSMIRDTWLVQRWKEVNAILSAVGIKHVLLKGMALEHTAYGAKGLRQMTDTDILVREDDGMKSWLLLQENGFTPLNIKSPLHNKILPLIGKHLPTLLKDGYPVEIHTRLFDESEKNEILGEAIDSAVEIDIDGTRAFILSDDIHLEYLKSHLEYHIRTGGAQLRQYLDMELIRPGSAPEFPEGFISNPVQPQRRVQDKDAYVAQFHALPRGIRLRYLAGDVFPSLKWMKQRHGCGTIRALLLYPRRIGKVLWILKA
jgi:hypothetical protein